MSGVVSVNELKAQQLEYVNSARDIEMLATQEERDVTDEEATAMEDLLAKAESLGGRINRLERFEQFETSLAASAGRKTEGPSKGTAYQVRDNAKISNPVHASTRDTGKWGFQSIGDYYRSVILSSRRGADKDARLIANAATTYSSGSDSETGFAIPPDFRPTIIRLISGEDSLLPRTQRMTTASNSVTLPVDDTAPWSSSGIQVYWESEAGTKTQSKIKGEPRTFRLGKLIALCPLTDELIEDAPGLESYVTDTIVRQMNWELTKALLQGDGVGKMLGVLNSGSLVTVAEESGQAADTIVPENIWNMYTHLYSECVPNAVWMVNHDVQAQLLGLKLTSNNSLVPLYVPPGGLSAAPYGTLLGRPVIATQACNTLGDLGDIVLVDWTKYLTVTKVAGPKNDISMHFYFDQDITAMRTVFRITGAPLWKTYLTPRTGTNYLSWAVTLAERS